MAVWTFYIDESYDNEKLVLCAFGIRHSHWKECFDELKAHRQRLKEDLGVYIRKEIHAHELVSGRGQISDRVIGKWQRSRIFFNLLSLASKLPNVMLFNVCLDKKAHKDPQLLAWDRVLNRIERTLLAIETRESRLRKTLISKTTGLSGSEKQDLTMRMEEYSPRAIIFSDEGREHEIQRIIRKMKVYNPIPSKFGAWGGSTSKSIPLQRIIEDPIFKKSHQSFFIQLVDCIAYALLKRETTPTERVKKYGLNKMFDECLEGICFKQASTADPLGIVRK